MKKPLDFHQAVFWYSRWESNPERPLRRGLLYPFNYGSIGHDIVYYKIGQKANILTESINNLVKNL